MAYTKQYDRACDDWSIGCIDEHPATSARLTWTPDGRVRVHPVHDLRRRYAARMQYVGSESRGASRPLHRESRKLTFTEQIVRDYRRAWRRISHQPKVDAIQ